MKPETVVQRITRESKAQLMEILRHTGAAYLGINTVGLLSILIDREYKRVMRKAGKQDKP